MPRVPAAAGADEVVRNSSPPTPTGLSQLRDALRTAASMPAQFYETHLLAAANGNPCTAPTPTSAPSHKAAAAAAAAVAAAGSSNRSTGRSTSGCGSSSNMWSTSATALSHANSTNSLATMQQQQQQGTRLLGGFAPPAPSAAVAAAAAAVAPEAAPAPVALPGMEHDFHAQYQQQQQQLQQQQHQVQQEVQLWQGLATSTWGRLASTRGGRSPYTSGSQGITGGSVHGGGRNFRLTINTDRILAGGSAHPGSTSLLHGSSGIPIAGSLDRSFHPPSRAGLRSLAGTPLHRDFALIGSADSVPGAGSTHTGALAAARVQMQKGLLLKPQQEGVPHETPDNLSHQLFALAEGDRASLAGRDSNGGGGGGGGDGGGSNGSVGRRGLVGKVSSWLARHGRKADGGRPKAPTVHLPISRPGTEYAYACSPPKGKEVTGRVARAHPSPVGRLACEPSGDTPGVLAASPQAGWLADPDVSYRGGRPRALGVANTSASDSVPASPFVGQQQQQQQIMGQSDASTAYLSGALQPLSRYQHSEPYGGAHVFLPRGESTPESGSGYCADSGGGGGGGGLLAVAAAGAVTMPSTVGLGSPASPAVHLGSPTLSGMSVSNGGAGGGPAAAACTAAGAGGAVPRIVQLTIRSMAKASVSPGSRRATGGDASYRGGVPRVAAGAAIAADAFGNAVGSPPRDGGGMRHLNANAMSTTTSPRHTAAAGAAAAGGLQQGSSYGSTPNMLQADGTDGALCLAAGSRRAPGYASMQLIGCGSSGGGDGGGLVLAGSLAAGGGGIFGSVPAGGGGSGGGGDPSISATIATAGDFVHLHGDPLADMAANGAAAAATGNAFADRRITSLSFRPPRAVNGGGGGGDGGGDGVPFPAGPFAASPGMTAANSTGTTPGTPTGTLCAGSMNAAAVAAAAVGSGFAGSIAAASDRLPSSNLAAARAAAAPSPPVEASPALPAAGCPDGEGGLWYEVAVSGVPHPVTGETLLLVVQVRTAFVAPCLWARFYTCWDSTGQGHRTGTGT